MLLQSFPQFPRLPPELRSYVWRMALRQPRVHRLRITTADVKQPFMLQPTETLPRSTITTRTILATCRESRREALRAVPDSLPLGNHVLRFDRSEDVICLVKVDINILEGVNAAVAKYRAQGDDSEDGGVLTGNAKGLDWVGSVRKLAFEVRNTNFQEDFGATFTGIETDHLPRFLAVCKNLEWVFLVPVPLPDNMETVNCRRSRGLGPSLGDDDTDEHETDEDDDEGYEEESDKEANATEKGKSHKTVCGGWIRGENGLSDWYCWVPGRTRWEYSNWVVKAHFAEMIDWRDNLKAALRRFSAALERSQRNALRSVQVQVMVHLREGVEPPTDI